MSWRFTMNNSLSHTFHNKTLIQCLDQLKELGFKEDEIKLIEKLKY